MRRRAFLALLALVCWLGPSGSAWADFAAGVRAYDASDFAAAHAAWLPLAEDGDPAAQRNLGHLYRFGRGVPQDFAAAATWYERAAATGLSGAQVNLAMMLLRGQGVTRDSALAAYWLEEAARQGHVLAQYNLAGLYLRGDGVPRDNVRGLGWLRLAAKGGHAEAKTQIQRLQRAARARAAKPGPGPTTDTATQEPPSDGLVSARALAAAKAERNAARARALPAAAPTTDKDETPPAASAEPGPLAADPDRPGAALERLIKAALGVGAAPSPPATDENETQARRVGDEVARLETPVAVDATDAQRQREALAEAVLLFNAGDLAGAQAILEPLALQGVVDAQYRLARMHEARQGAENLAEAYVWLVLAAEGGHGKARIAKWRVLDAMDEAARRNARALLRARRIRLAP